MTLTIDEAKAIWEPQHDRILNVIERAWNEYKLMRDYRMARGLAPLLYDRTKSNDIFDAIARAAFDEFGTDPAFMLKVETQTFKLFHKGCCIRFKKGGSNLLGQNITTQAVLGFVEADGCLPNMPPNTAKLEIIWLADELFTDLGSVHIVSRDGDYLIWEYSLDRSNDSHAVVPLPIAPVDPYNEDGSSLIKPRNGKEEESEADRD